MLPILIDTHCHLYANFGEKKPDDLIREAKLANVGVLLTIGVDISTLRFTQEISEKHENVFHTVGIHPHEAGALTDADFDQIEKASAHPKCVGIGEIGLDYYYNHAPKEVQREVFRRQLAMAKKVGKPVVVHSRDAEDDVLEELTAYAKDLSPTQAPGVLHCFTGSREFGEACLKLGFYISFSGVLTFKNSDPLRESARAYPMDRLLVETDSPYLAPIPHRGKRCEPSMVTFTAMKLAEVKGISFEEVARATTENAIKLFRLPIRKPGDSG